MPRTSPGPSKGLVTEQPGPASMIPEVRIADFVDADHGSGQATKSEGLYRIKKSSREILHVSECSSE
jgi:hypothetical protein